MKYDVKYEAKPETKPQQIDLFTLKKQVIEELKSELNLAESKPNTWT